MSTKKSMKCPSCEETVHIAELEEMDPEPEVEFDTCPLSRHRLHFR